MSQSLRFDHETLTAFGTDVYAALGMSRDDAAIVSDTLVQADLWGHQSHGVLRMPWYAARLQSGVCKADAQPSVIVDGGAIAVLDGHDGMGQIVALHGIREAIRRAKAHGIGAVSIRNSGHFGTAMYFTRKAADEGCVGFVSTNASPAMAPWGGRSRTLGNNPWSWAAPAGNYPHMVLDIANTAVARGKIYLARQRGETIPPTWALDKTGAPTTDPASAIEGLIQPMGQHKGYAISVLMDVLSGVLSGGAFGTGVTGPYQADKRSGVGHLMIALDISAFQPREAFLRRMEQYVGELKSGLLSADTPEIFYPGEPEARSDAHQRAHGIVLPADTVEGLTRLGRELGLESPGPIVSRK